MPFTYTAPDTSAATGTIARLMQLRGQQQAELAARVGDIQARATEQSGQAWAGAAQNIGQAVGAIPGQIERGKIQALDSQQKVAQITDLRAQADQRVAAARKQKAVDDQNNYIDMVMQKSMKPDPETGVISFDRPTFEQGLVSSGMGHLYPTLAETLDKLDASAAKRNAESKTMLAHGLLGIEQAGYTPESVLSTAAYLKANGVIKAEQLLPVQEAMAENPSPENIKRIVSTLAGNLPQYQAEKDASAKKAADLAKTNAETEKAQADAAKLRSEAVRGPKRTEAEQELDAYAKSIGKTSADDLTYADRQVFGQNKEKIRSGAAFQQHMRERQYDNANPAPVKKADQDKLEQEYRTVLTRGLSSRSGGLGGEDAKVQQANHLISLFEQTYNPKTGGYDIPRVQLNELALGLAKLTAGNSPAGEGMLKEFQQRTAKGDVAGALTYLTGQPVPANTQAITAFLKDSIERQGKTAEQNREGEMAYLRGLAPTDLEEPRRQKLEATSLNPLRQSRVAVDAQGNKKLFMSIDGGKTWK